MGSKYKAAELSSCLSDPQIKLSKALINRDITEFRAALNIGANALAKDEQNLSIFEKALQTPGCAEFVKECLKNGCEPNHINSFYDKAAINFATDSREPQNLNELLSISGINVDYRYSDLTPLNSLAKNLCNENATKVVECMKILLRYGASPNVPDQREMTPLHNVIKNRKINDVLKYEIVQMFVSLPNLDIDTYREGELRQILESEYPLMELPAKNLKNLTTFHSLLGAIRSGNMAVFEQQFNDKSRNLSQEEEVQLLIASIEVGAHKAFDLILACEVDYNRTVRQNNTPLEISWIFGNWYALEKLLQQPLIKVRPKDHPLINIVCKLNDGSFQEFCNYWKCFYVLLDSDKIDINAFDFSKSTALHYAVRYHNNKAVKELLKRGACISIENTFKELPLNGMSPVVWEEHLDDCVSSSDDKFGDKTYEIIISFKNFMTSQQKTKKQLKEVLSPIAFMAKSKEYRYLLQHPVITSILYLKWHKLSLIFYINFLCYMFFAISLITHAVLKFRETEYVMAEKISVCCAWFGICYFIAREFIQFIVSPLKYLVSVTNYLEILLIFMSILTCESFDIDKDKQRNIAVGCILLLTYELVLLVGSLPVASLSTHMLMLEAVCKSFLKGFLLYSIFIITFTLCFYIKNANEPVENEEEAFHRFANPLVAFAKTIVMFTGEFDAGSLKLDSNYTYLLFLSFVFFMTIILFNLLNGLAVSDTQAIKDQAEINDIICRTNLLYRYEKAVFRQTANLSFLLKRQPFRLLCQIINKSFPDYTTDVQISIFPNNKNKIVGPKISQKRTLVKINDIEKDENVTVSLSDDGVENDVLTKNKLITCWFSCLTDRCSRIDERTVTQAMAILEKKSTQSIESRLENMEAMLHKIMKSLDIKPSKDTICDAIL